MTLIASALVVILLFFGSSASADTSFASQNTPINPTASASQEASTTAGGATTDLVDQKINATVYTDATLQHVSQDTTISVSGALPTGGYATAYPVDLSMVEGDDVLTAYNITAYQADGTEFVVDDPLTVTVDVPDMPSHLQGDDLSLVYVPANNQKPEALDTPVKVTDAGVAFTVEHFSVYAVTVGNVNSATIAVDGIAQPGITVSGTSGSAPAITITSTYPDEEHTFSLSSNNQNLIFTSITKDGEEQLTGGQFAINTQGDLLLTYSFDHTTTFLVYYNNNNATSGTKKSVVLTIVITVVGADIALGIKDTLAQDGRLNAVLNATITDPVIAYTWYKSATQDGSYTPVNADALENGGVSVNVAVDSGAKMWYKVEVTLDNGDGATTTETSSSYQVPYYASIQNGSFETPDASLRSVGNANYSQFADGTPGLFWHTTASDGLIEIGVPTSISSGSPYGLTEAAEGSRFAELNATTIGTLYQDVLVTPGETLYWSLAHAGRLGEDTMNVIIMPLSDVGTADLPKVGDNAPSGTTVISDDARVSVTSITDDMGSWNTGNGGKDYADQYVVPDGVYVVRFYFESVSAAGDDLTKGNLLDDITFSSDMPYTIEYYVNNTLMASSSANGEYRAASETVINANGEIIDPDGQDTQDAYLKGLFEDYDGNPANTLQKTVLTTMDTSTGTAVAGGRDLERATSFTLTKANSVLQLYYVTAGVFVNKKVVGVASEDMPDNYKVSFALYDSGGNMVGTTARLYLAGGNLNGSLEFVDGSGNPVALAAGTYTVEELGSDDIDGYTYVSTTQQGVTGIVDSNETPLTPGSDTPATEATFEVTGSTYSIYEIYFTNTYRPTTTSVTVSKVVTGEYGDKTRSFAFQAHLSDDHGNPMQGAYACTDGVVAGTAATPPSYDAIQFNDEGIALFSLSHGQSITILDVPTEYNIQIVEAPDSNYTTSFISNGASPAIPIECGDTGMVAVSPNLTFMFTNARVAAVLSGIGAGSIGALIPEAAVVVLITAMIIAGKSVASRRRRGGIHGAK